MEVIVLLFITLCTVLIVLVLKAAGSGAAAVQHTELAATKANVLREYEKMFDSMFATDLCRVTEQVTIGDHVYTGQDILAKANFGDRLYFAICPEEDKTVQVIWRKKYLIGCLNSEAAERVLPVLHSEGQAEAILVEVGGGTPYHPELGARILVGIMSPERVQAANEALLNSGGKPVEIGGVTFSPITRPHHRRRWERTNAEPEAPPDQQTQQWIEQWNKHYFANVSGTSYSCELVDQSRLGVLYHCKVGEKLSLLRTPENKYDANAILLVRESGEDIGHVPREIARWIAPKLDRGAKAEARIVELLGAQDGKAPKGVNVVIGHNRVPYKRRMKKEPTSATVEEPKQDSSSYVN
jgi:hypothetical protein